MTTDLQQLDITKELPIIDLSDEVFEFSQEIEEESETQYQITEIEESPVRFPRLSAFLQKHPAASGISGALIIAVFFGIPFLATQSLNSSGDVVISDFVSEPKVASENIQIVELDLEDNIELAAESKTIPKQIVVKKSKYIAKKTPFNPIARPVNPGPVDPGPVDPDPVDPDPVDPDPVDPDPVDPDPVDPDPVDPDPLDP